MRVLKVVSAWSILDLSQRALALYKQSMGNCLSYGEKPSTARVSVSGHDFDSLNQEQQGGGSYNRQSQEPVDKCEAKSHGIEQDVSDRALFFPQMLLDTLTMGERLSRANHRKAGEIIGRISPPNSQKSHSTAQSHFLHPRMVHGHPAHLLSTGLLTSPLLQPPHTPLRPTTPTTIWTR